MRTLTKERVSPSALFNNSGILSLDLIGDGPREIVAKAIVKFSKDNESASLSSQQTFLVKKEEQRKRNFAQSFVKRYTEIFGITRNQLGELINLLKTEDILVLDNQLTMILRKKALLHNIGWSSYIGIFLLSILCFFLSEDTLVGALMFFMFSSMLGPFIFLSENFYNENTDRDVPDGPVSHMALRRYLKNKCGPNYFPYQELKEELGLMEKSGADTYYTPNH